MEKNPPQLQSAQGGGGGNGGASLVNEAIKRILLDVIIRGHGDRLIGRWSREPELEQFLEQVPYLLDRINQLHLACTRAAQNQETLEHSHHHHHHHHHAHHHHHHHHHHQERQNSGGQSSLTDLITLIGSDYHWLVRTRDPLGLTPLHKAVLFNNVPVAEYLVDRYQEELAASSWPTRRDPGNFGDSREKHRFHPLNTKLIDAQDKYGRTALHYAAGLLNDSSVQSTTTERELSSLKRANKQLYHYFILRGASMGVKDFRGKTAAHYVRHPNQLRAKSVIHLANKLNANYQANVLSKTLRAQAKFADTNRLAQPLEHYYSSNKRPANLLDGTELSAHHLSGENVSLKEANSQNNLMPESNRESMSISSNDLRSMGESGLSLVQSKAFPRSRSSATLKDKKEMDEEQELEEASVSQLKKGSKSVEQTDWSRHRSYFSLDSNLSRQVEHRNRHKLMMNSCSRFESADEESEDEKDRNEDEDETRSSELEVAYKQLVLDRCSRVILDQETKLRVKRCLSEGIVDKINELLIEGYGEYICQEGAISCWNQHCKRYIKNVIPEMLARVDTLHEFISDDQLFRVKTLLNLDPILGRIRRPYKRAAMNSLHLAVHLDRRVIVKFLARKYPELIKQQDSHGATCLHWAAKSLRHDWLYNWLLEHFGSRVEHIRDSRGKTAADYRIQAYKLFNFSENHPNLRIEQKGSEEIMKKTQLESNKLQFTGARIEMRSKKSSQHHQINRTPSLAADAESSGKSNLNRSVTISTTCSGKVKVGDEKKVNDSEKQEPLDASIEIDIDSPTTPELPPEQNLGDDLEVGVGERPGPTFDTFQSDLIEIVGKETGQSDRSNGRVSSASVRLPKDSTSSRRFSDSTTNSSRQTKILSSSGIREVDPVSSWNNSELIKEMVQLDSSEFAEISDNTFNYPRETTNPKLEGNNNNKKRSLGEEGDKLVALGEQNNETTDEYREEDSPLTTPSLPLLHSSDTQSTTTTTTTPVDGQQPRSSLKLDQLILYSIGREDLKKLEHLILAGCGRRVLKVFELNKNNKKMKTHKKLLQFLEVQTPIYIQRILEIHQVLHTCYNYLELNGQQQQQIAPFNDDLQAQVNRQFHKLCNLLDRRRLIMCRDSFGASPLHVATMRSDTRLIEYLLRRHPEAASAPDHDNRNACHYAAIVLSVYRQHKSFRLTNSLGGSNEGNMTGFWLIDDHCQVIYDNLSLRYGELLESRDKFGLTCGDYLARCNNEEEHFENNLECCKDYQQLLNRYNYEIIDEMNRPELSTTEKDQSQQQQQQPKQLKRNKSESVITGQRKQQKPPQVSGKTKVLLASKSRTEDSLLKDLDQTMLTSSLSDIPSVQINAKQVAPRPTVGSDSGFALHMPHAMYTDQDEDIINLEVAKPLLNSNPKEQEQYNQTSGVFVDELEQAAKRSSPNHQNQHHHHHHHHSHHRHHHKKHGHHHNHHHHHHHHHHHVSSRSPSVKSPNGGISSVVGGIIVPTIIHNDQMDQIETFDIIYRQPTQTPSTKESRRSSTSSSASSTSSSSSWSRTGSSASLECVSSPSIGANHITGEEEGIGKEVEGVGQEAGSCSESESGSKSSSSSSSSSSDIDSNDDERAERLSNEFELRVRREKNELKAKVDQIMNEIKLSAKSGKSSRFLASPIDGLVKDSLKAGNTSNTVMFMEQQQQLANNKHQSMNPSSVGKQQQSISSSGRSSARTSCSSASSFNSNSSHSNLTTCSSSSSASSGTGSSKENNSRKTTTASSSSSSITLVNGIENELKPKGIMTKKASLSQAKQNNPEDSELFKLTQQIVSKNTYGQTYLHFIASRAQNPTTFYKVLEHGHHLIGERDIFYRTARDVALQFNLSNNVQVLDKFIIDLFIGANTILLRHLLNQGYSPLIHVSDPDGNDIMLILKLLKLDRMIHHLLQMADFQRWRDELHTFIRNGYSAGVSELIKKHADLIKAKSAHARTSLHLAVLFDRPVMVKELVGADPSSVHTTDNMGRTALHYTYGLNLKNVEEIRDCLLEKGASIETRDVKMRTPKYYYIFKREIEDIRRLELELN